MSAQQQQQPGTWQPQSYQLHNSQLPGMVYPYPTNAPYPAQLAAPPPYVYEPGHETEPVPDEPPPAYDQVYPNPPYVVQPGYRQGARPKQWQRRSSETSTTSSDSRSPSPEIHVITTRTRRPAIPRMPEELLNALRTGTAFGIGLVIIGGVGIQYRMFGFRAGAGIWAGILAVWAFGMSAETRKGSIDETRRLLNFIINLLAFIAVIFFLCWHGYGLSVERPLLDQCKYRSFNRVKYCNGTEFNGLITFPFDKAQIIGRLALQGVGVGLASLIVLIFVGTRMKMQELSNRINSV